MKEELLADNNKEVYDWKDVAKLYNCKRDKAYLIIRGLNNLLIKDGTPKESIVSGKISKKFFHEKIKI